jgi:hypothetical protein
MNDVERFADLTKQLIVAMEGLAAALPPWRDTLGKLSDMTTGAMRYHGVSGSSGAYWDLVASDLGLERMEAARLALVDALAQPVGRLPGPGQP